MEWLPPNHTHPISTCDIIIYRTMHATTGRIIPSSIYRAAEMRDQVKYFVLLKKISKGSTDLVK